MARPKKEIDWDLAERSAALFCTGQEIANLCTVSLSGGREFEILVPNSLVEENLIYWHILKQNVNLSIFSLVADF